MTLQEHCDLSDFCYELSGGHDTEYRRTYPDGPRSRFLLENSVMVAMADMSPIVRGHCLVAPRSHELSMAAIAKKDPWGLEDFVSQFLSGYMSVYGTAAVFEHGSGTTLNPSACVVHAHLHVVPLARSILLGELESDGLQLVPVDGWSVLGGWVPDDSPYYLAGDVAQLSVALGSRNLPKQYFRVVMGRIMNYEPSLCDWAACVRKELFSQTISDLGACFEVK